MAPKYPCRDYFKAKVQNMYYLGTCTLRETLNATMTRTNIPRTKQTEKVGKIVGLKGLRAWHIFNMISYLYQFAQVSAVDSFLAFLSFCSAAYPIP